MATLVTSKPAPVVSIPASSANVLINPIQHLAMNAVSVFGGILAAGHIDVGSIINTIAGGSFWGGLLAMVVPQVINYFATNASNNATQIALTASSGTVAAS